MRVNVWLWNFPSDCETSQADCATWIVQLASRIVKLAARIVKLVLWNLKFGLRNYKVGLCNSKGGVWNSGVIVKLLLWTLKGPWGWEFWYRLNLVDNPSQFEVPLGWEFWYHLDLGHSKSVWSSMGVGIFITSCSCGWHVCVIFKFYGGWNCLEEV